MHIKSLVNSSILITGGTGSFGQAMTNYLCNNVKKTIIMLVIFFIVCVPLYCYKKNITHNI